MLRAALIDVGGTLWPEKGPYIERQKGRLQALFPESGDREVTRLLRAFGEPARKWESPTELEQDTYGVITDVLRHHGLESMDPASVREALCVPAAEGAELFPGAVELLRTSHELGLRTVLVSNTAWRDAEDYRRDFEYFGARDLIGGIVTSLDLGFRKPHEAIFRAALQLAGCKAEECVFIGDSEKKDVVPAAKRGMRTVLIAIEQRPPSTTAADAVATSLDQAAELVRAWARAPKGS